MSEYNDASHAAVLDACRRILAAQQKSQALSILGAPATGKTTLIRQCVQEIVAHSPESRIAVLSPDRRAATELRNTLVTDMGVLGEGTRVQSIAAFAFGIVSAYAQAVGRREPELLSGPDQDALIKDIIDVSTRYYPSGMLGTINPDVASLEAFRSEYRDLITRAAELGITSSQLAQYGEQTDNPSWVIGAELMEKYEDALAVQAAVGHQNPDRTDHSRIVTQAAAFIQQWGEHAELSLCPTWDWVFVDDLANCTLALRSLLRVLQDNGTCVVVCGDPDAGVQSYRGGIHQLQALIEHPRTAGGLGARRYVLAHRYRGGGQLAPYISKVTSGIHVSRAAQQRSADYTYAPECAFSGHTFVSAHEEIAYLAQRMRHIHNESGVAYSDMAVFTRSRSGHENLRHALMDHGIPVQPLPSVTPLRFQGAVSDLLLMIKTACGMGEEAEIAEAIRTMLAGPFFGYTAAHIAALNRQMHGWEIFYGGKRQGDRLLAAMFEEGPNNPAADIPEFNKIRSVAERIRRAVQSEQRAERVLWEAWDGLGKAEEWREEVLAGGVQADIADANLDAVIQLFRVAQRLADRDPANALVGDLIRVLEEQDVPEDSIARTSAGAEGISVVSPTAGIGRSWGYVFISQVNDGIWPNLRLRNPLTRVPELVSIVVGSELAGAPVQGIQQVAEVLDDELRMLLSCMTRATDGVEITCVESDDNIPSRFVPWLFSDDFGALFTHHSHAAVTLDSATFIGQLRQAQRQGHDRIAASACDYLQKMAEHDIAGMGQKLWVDDLEYTKRESEDVETIRISPSAVENMLTCPLRGVLDSANGQSLGNASLAHVGTLVHQIAEETEEPDLDMMRARLDELWAAFDFGTDLADQQLYERAVGMVTKLHQYLTENPATEQRELYARVERDGLVVSGKIDRLEFSDMDPSAVRVVDFKTGKSSPRKEDADRVPQLLIYQWLVEQGGVIMPEGGQTPTRSLGARLVHIGKETQGYGLTEQSELDAERTKEAEQMINRSADIQRSHAIEAQINSGCRSCTYITICPAKEGKRIFS